MAKEKKITKIDIISFFMDDTVKNQEVPVSVERFSKAHAIPVDLFKNYFSSLKALEKEIFQLFFTNTRNALDKDQSYSMFDARNQVLSFYYTFFENLTANRAYVLVALRCDTKSLKPLKKLSSPHRLARLHLLSAINAILPSSQSYFNHSQP